MALPGSGAVGKLLVASQVVLSPQPPLTLWPLIRMTDDCTRLTRAFANRLLTRVAD